ncbi:MAG TPA: hypothetical protein VM686_34065 [Polyangiaceae bacterium]|jgi:hypothetical protein|nr:hypothetical protein [Polyangiaceae bacterium]
MAHAKIPSEPYAPESVRGIPSNAFMPVLPKPRRYSRGVLWADRSGLPEPDFSRLSLMRAMERKNKG